MEGRSSFNFGKRVVGAEHECAQFVRNVAFDLTLINERGDNALDLVEVNGFTEPREGDAHVLQRHFRVFQHCLHAMNQIAVRRQLELLQQEVDAVCDKKLSMSF